METAWIIVALIIAALVFIFLEILTPMFGALAGAGIAALVAAVWVAFTVSPVAGIVLTVVLLICVPLYTWYLVKYLPRSPLGRKLFLGKARDATAEGTPESETLEHLVGKEGTTESTLRPSGAVRIDGRRFVGQAESGMIQHGQAVRVVSAGGTTLIVRPVEDGSDS